MMPVLKLLLGLPAPGPDGNPCLLQCSVNSFHRSGYTAWRWFELDGTRSLEYGTVDSSFLVISAAWP